ncbi:MAG: sodium:proton antiporter [Sulfurimonas sp. RIFCSPHIGHO2_12_FULL_36_9]|uniref:sodium:proton antiporter NhaD n=1 Tax=Sulfurimonas sp. RIFCSPLOWO2_12_36_12 TaxID=1802253 RepID=UPI0008D5B523|nr:sodium:proton antiporter NhaD [Sulfurimonas sp. RIFCSPLOWO2_12_36_12]OHD97499.1 MAG: sodium:proton antiporter [Sulfurimonas sp. RIFCSPHIGHO2_12_FULL_36_9]OHE00139.1 MAG: sodium:proton antiporter [Sulfurimonas sp. RIFCSPLOWO2_02_FULL_36_28]OHE02967.1 MAG: sodium:proton antiporter [Sulfurimonas sp. RIFCSPLOWO2_12_36_12]OHE07893.1 MAG: sodium:proton antiporter [Sulfurimonas sp. RIFCSPLOWO2_12_FULL_36_74]
MIKLLIVLLSSTLAYAGSGSADTEVLPNLTMTWIGFASLAIFMAAYYFVATEEKYHIDKAKPALFAGTFMFILVAFYYAINGMDMNLVHTQVEHMILEIAEIFFFLFVAMTYIESMIHMGVFDRLKYNLVSKGYSYKKLFWLTGFLAFFISPIADNLTTALILSTVLITIERKNKEFLVPGAINIVVAANAGGAWSPFGDITTLMAWASGKGEFVDFLFLLPASIGGYVITAYLLSMFVPKEVPHFDASSETKPEMMKGAEVVIGLGAFTVFAAVISHQVLHLPAMWGMLFGLSLLKLYAYRLKKVHNSEFNVFHSIAKIENNTLLFFFGILAAVGALYFVGWLGLAAIVYDPSVLGPTWANIGVGFLSAIVDNVPVMSAILKANPDMGVDQWMLVTLTAGVGGSLISFGSAAGVGVMGKLPGIYTFGSHMKYAWTIFIGYAASVAIWYVQYQVLGLYIKH